MAPPRKGRPSSAKRKFVDRDAPRRIVENAAFAIPTDRSIIRVFYGVGGQGKTALCREILRMTDPASEPAYAYLRRAELDLHGRTKEDPDRLLVWIRNGFAEAGVAFPRFDLSFALAWDATRGDEPLPMFSRPWLRRGKTAGQFIDGSSDLVKDLSGELIGSIPGIGFMLKRLGEWSIEKTKRYYLERTKEELKELYDGSELKKPYQLSELLPWMLAQDLNAHLAANPDDRFLLLVDEYERVADEGGAGVKWRDSPFDAHMRRLIAETNGMLAIFFSREKLPWETHADWRADLEGNQHLLGGLAESDAEEFLLSVAVEDAALRRVMVEAARETAEPGAPIYPLMLDLQVEHWNALREKGEAVSTDDFAAKAESFSGRRLAIVRRVLRDYGTPLQTTLERLSVARRFDRAAFAHVVNNFGTALPLDQFARVAALSFVSTLEDGYLSIHNLVAETIRETLSAEMHATSTEALLSHFLDRSRTASPAEVKQAHVTALVEAAWLRLQQGVEGYVAWLKEGLENIERSSLARGAIRLWREALDACESGLGPDQLDTATCLARLGKAIAETGDTASARPLLERALAIREARLGAEHSDTAASLGELASLHHSAGDYAAARPMFERALAVMRQADGPYSERLATGLNNLGSLLQDTGDYEPARVLYEQALSIDRALLGEEHPETAAVLNNLAILLRTIGDFAGAKPLYERALAISEKSLGAEHPDTAANLNNLATLLQAMGDPQGARPLFERSLAIREKVQGPRHPDTAASLNSFAVLLELLDEPQKAREMYERSLAIREDVLGADHPHLALTLNNLGNLLRHQEPETARDMLERSRSINEKVLGPDHPTLAVSLNNLAMVLKRLGELGAAVGHAERALAITEGRLGSEHPTTNRLRANVASMRLAAGSAAEALELAQSALEAHQRVLGSEHRWTADTAQTTADILNALGRDEEAGALRSAFSSSLPSAG